MNLYNMICMVSQRNCHHIVFVFLGTWCSTFHHEVAAGCGSGGMQQQIVAPLAFAALDHCCWGSYIYVVEYSSVADNQK